MILFCIMIFLCGRIGRMIMKTTEKWGIKHKRVEETADKPAAKNCYFTIYYGLSVGLMCAILTITVHRRGSAY